MRCLPPHTSIDNCYAFALNSGDISKPGVGLQSTPFGKSQSQIVALDHAAEPKHVYRSIPPWSDLAWREMKDLGIG